jgi:membrane-associated phospholipid phosphatase
MNRYKKFLKNHKQIWTLLYVCIYFPWFCYLEKTVTTDYYLIECELDDKIPFCEYFIIPYLLWFFYIGITIAWFLFKESKHSYYQLTGLLFGGMTICLLICTIFPNGLNIRPEINFDKNIFTRLTSIIYTADTSTNVFPSIHVFTSVAVVGAIRRSQAAQNHRWILPASSLLSLLIVLSTMFLKQHSVVDVTAGILLGVAMREFVYAPEERRALKPVVSVGNK